MTFNYDGDQQPELPPHTYPSCYRKIYVASSWRNTHQPTVVEKLMASGHLVYDFRNPRPGDVGFGWSEIDKGWQDWDTLTYRAALHHPTAVDGFTSDMEAMRWADTCVLVLPCGRSAHIEAGWFCGANKSCWILIPKGEAVEPELMYSMASGIVSSIDELLGKF